MADLAIAVIHGMGTHEAGYSDKMQEAIKNSLKKKGKDPDRIKWIEIVWSDLFDDKEKLYLKRTKSLNHGKDLGWPDTRGFVVSAFGDATGYHSAYPDDPTGSYWLVHRRIADRLSELRTETCPLVLMAHSLGGTMITDYIWNIQTSKAYVPGLQGLLPFERFETLAGIITFGCNLPLFTFAYDPVEIIKFPNEKVLQQWGPDKAKWINIFSNCDILGYPLQSINAMYAAKVKDIKVNVGIFPISRTPLSHSLYWTDPEFVRPSSDLIAGFL